MSQRTSGYIRKERDRYMTPEWVTEALIPHLPTLFDGAKVWEPACGTGQVSRVLERVGFKVLSTDIEPQGYGETVPGDFLEHALGASAIITNPPYEQAQAFCEHALNLMESRGGAVAMLLRTDFDHAKSRTHLFRDCPAFAKKLVLMRRIVWFVESNGKPKASPSYNHAWFIWSWAHEGPPTIGYAT